MRQDFPKNHLKLRFIWFFGSSFLAVAVWVLWILALALPVAAHAELLTADPTPGEMLAASPTEVRLTFSEALQAGSTLVIFGEGFAQVPGISPAIDAQAPEQLTAGIPALAQGRYTVQWTAVTADGHEVSGSYSFTVQAGPQERWGVILLWVLAGGIILAVLVLYRIARRA